jgi:hypothetical protein
LQPGDTVVFGPGVQIIYRLAPAPFISWTKVSKIPQKPFVNKYVNKYKCPGKRGIRGFLEQMTRTSKSLSCKRLDGFNTGALRQKFFTTKARRDTKFLSTFVSLWFNLKLAGYFRQPALGYKQFLVLLLGCFCEFMAAWEIVEAFVWSTLFKYSPLSPAIFSNPLPV